MKCHCPICQSDDVWFETWRGLENHLTFHPVGQVAHMLIEEIILRKSRNNEL